MDVASLQRLIGQAISLRSAVECVDGSMTIRIDGSGNIAVADPAPSAVAEAVPDGTADAIVAPCFGIVHLSPSPGAPPFVMPGDAVVLGQKVCLVEAMKVFSAVVAPRAGNLEQVLVKSGEEVARGQSLFRLSPADGQRDV